MALDRNLNVNIKGSETVSTYAERAAKALEDNLAKAAITSAKAYGTLSKNAETTNKQLERTAEISQKAGQSQAKNLKIVETSTKSTLSTLEKMLNIFGKIQKGIEIVGSALIIIYGQEKVFELITEGAVRFSNVIERLANWLDKLGGPFKFIVPILKTVTALLRTNASGLAGFALIGTEAVEAATDIRKSFVLMGKEQLTLADKLKIGGMALDRYGDILRKSDGFINKTKGVLVELGAIVAKTGGVILDVAPNIVTQMALIGGAFLAVAAYQPMFEWTIISIDKLQKTIRGLSFDSAMLQERFISVYNETTPLIKNLERLRVKVVTIANIFKSQLKNVLAAPFRSAVKQLNLFDRSAGAMQVKTLTRLSRQFQLFGQDIKMVFDHVLRTYVPAAITFFAQTFQEAFNSLGSILTKFSKIGQGVINGFRNLIAVGTESIRTLKTMRMHLVLGTKAWHEWKVGYDNLDQITRQNLAFKGAIHYIKGLSIATRSAVSSILAFGLALNPIGMITLSASGASAILTNKIGNLLLAFRNFDVFIGRTLNNFGYLIKEGKILSSTINSIGLTISKSFDAVKLQGMGNQVALISTRFAKLFDNMKTLDISKTIGKSIETLGSDIIQVSNKTNQTLISNAKQFNTAFGKSFSSFDKTLTKVIINTGKIKQATQGLSAVAGKTFTKLIGQARSYTKANTLANFQTVALTGSLVALSEGDYFSAAIMAAISLNKELASLGLQATEFAAKFTFAFIRSLPKNISLALTLTKTFLKSFSTTATNTFLNVQSAISSMVKDMLRSLGFLHQSVGAASVSWKTLLRLRADRFANAAKASFQSLGVVVKNVSTIIQSELKDAILRTIYYTDQLIRKFALGQTQMSMFVSPSILGELNNLKNTLVGIGKISLTAIVDQFSKLGPMIVNSVDTGISALERMSAKMMASSLDVTKLSGYLRMQLNRSLMELGALTAKYTVKGLEAFKVALIETNRYAKVVVEQVKIAGGVLNLFNKIVKGAVKHTEFFHKGLGGLTLRSAAFSSVFNILGINLLRSDSTMKKMAGVTLIALGVALGSLALLIRQVLLLVGDLIYKIGTELTLASEKQIAAFAKAEETTYAFEQTIVSYSHSTDMATESVKNWTKYVAASSKVTGETESNIRALVAETVGATEAFGFNEKQMQKLISRSIDLSQRAHRPAIDTLTALINGINGNTASLVIYGLHLNESAIQHSKLSDEIKSTYKSMNEIEKGQVRYAVLMEQAGKAAGFAEENSNTYSKGLMIQRNAVLALNEQLGKGAEIVNGRVVVGLAKATELLTSMIKPILPLIGFLQALSGRFLQLTGIFLSHTLMISLLVTTYVALKKAMLIAFAADYMLKKIPLVNASLAVLAARQGIVNVNWATMGGLSMFALKSIIIQTKIAIVQMFNYSAVMTYLTIIKGAFVTVTIAATKAMWGFIASIAAFLVTPVGMFIAAIAAALLLMWKALVMLEEETKIFTNIWNNLTSAFTGTSSVLKPVMTIFQKIGSFFSTVFTNTIRIVAIALGSLIYVILQIAKVVMKLSQVFRGTLLNSFAAGDKAIRNVTKSINSLGDGLSSLAAKFFGIEDASRSIAGGHDAHAKSLDALKKEYNKLLSSSKKAFDFVGEFAPTLKLEAIKKQAAKYEDILLKLKKKGEEVQKAMATRGPAEAKDTSVDNIILSKIKDQTKKTELALKGLRLKIASEVRQARIKEVELELTARKNLVFTTEQEIKQMRFNNAKETRQLSVNMERERLLALRNLATEEQRTGLTAKEQGLIEANEKELEIYKSQMNNQMKLAVDMETQKQIALAEVKAGALEGAGPSGAKAKADLEIQQEQAKMQQLQMLRNQDKINEVEYRDAIAQIQYSKINESTQRQMEMYRQRQDMLGLSASGWEAQQAQLAIQWQMEFDLLKARQENEKMSNEEFNESKEEIERRHLERTANAKEKFIQDEIKRHEKLGEVTKASLKKIQLAQQRHGNIMGAMQGVTQSAEYKGLQGSFSKLATLRNTKSRRLWKLGQASAIASAVMNTAAGAIAALAPPPVGAGPLVGPLLAASTVAAGLVQLQNIKNQKFQGGQADQGMDFVPQSMHGKSFIVSGGERIVQPEANKQLTRVMTALESGTAGGGNNFYFSVYGEVPESQLSKLTESVKEGIREASERGEPIIHERGVVNG